MTPVTAIALSLILLTLSPGNQGTAPVASSDVNPPKGAKLVFQADAKGDQIYTCKEQNGQYSWTLQGPDAQLFDKHKKVIGRHFRGPSWELNDKSAVTGRMIKHVDAPYKDAVPWLLLEAVSHSGRGKLSSVAFIQRINTRGGQAPAAGCDASSAAKEVRSPYSATYRFFSSKAK